MRKTYFNATILDDKPTGLGVYTNNIINNMDDVIIDNYIFTDKMKKIHSEKINYKSIFIKCESNKKIVSVFLRNINLKRVVNKESKKNKMLFYSPTQHGLTNKKIQQIITIHDLMPLLYPEGRRHQYFYYKHILPNVIKCSEKIITVSTNTKNDIIKHYNVSPEKIEVIYNGYDKPENVNKEESINYIYNKYKIKKFLLMMGINYSYKNLHSVIMAYKEIKNDISYKLVIVGNKNIGYGRELIELVNQNNLNEDVIFLGYIEDADKHKIYQAAELFIYPSLYEGFGLPILEAMANKTMVMCSNSSSLPEVAGDAALYFDPKNIEEIRIGIVNMLSLNSKYKQAYINKGIENLKRFDWCKTAKQVSDVIVNIKNK